MFLVHPFLECLSAEDCDRDTCDGGFDFELGVKLFFYLNPEGFSWHYLLQCGTMYIVSQFGGLVNR